MKRPLHPKKEIGSGEVAGRRTFIETGLVTFGTISAMASGIGALLEAQTTASGDFIRAINPRLTDHKFSVTNLSAGSETVASLSFEGDNGVTANSRSFLKKVDAGATYYAFLHTVLNWFKPGETAPAATAVYAVFYTGTKGEVNGAFRADQIQATYLTTTGTIATFPVQTVKVRIDTPPVVSVPTQEQLDNFMNSIPCCSGKGSRPDPAAVPAGVSYR